MYLIEYVHIARKSKRKEYQLFSNLKFIRETVVGVENAAKCK